MIAVHALIDDIVACCDARDGGQVDARAMCHALVDQLHADAEAALIAGTNQLQNELIATRVERDRLRQRLEATEPPGR